MHSRKIENFESLMVISFSTVSKLYGFKNHASSSNAIAKGGGGVLNCPMELPAETQILATTQDSHPNSGHIPVSLHQSTKA